MITATRGTLRLGYKPAEVYHNPIYRIRYTSRGIILRIGYQPGGVRSGHIESDTAGYPLGGVSYSVLLSSGFRANSYAARWLSVSDTLLPN